MSITTYGFGSGAITTQGWGAGAPAAAAIGEAPPFFGLAGDLLHIIIRLRHEVRCKVDPVVFQTQLDGQHDTLQALESCYTRYFARLRSLENTHPLVFDVEGAVDCKITEAEFDSKRAVVDVGMDAISSDMKGFLQRLRALERQLRLLRRNT